MVYTSLFAISFLAATIFPLSSELTLASLLSTNNYNPLLLIISASSGNILGSIFNYLLGFYLLKHFQKKWFPFKAKHISSATKWFNKFGVWSLLLSWVPIIGDPITFVAGIFKINFYIFVILVSLGKILRYLVLIAMINNYI
jgi:membrane protein YqaA with SNARE-associated domain|tara:strand:+ start:73 stop:498 length:426 start_codon:yes stop_codon:yes gene_type:complete